MVMLFICGTLEQGKSGVGDHMRRLAAELIRQGKMVYLLAINDSHINSISEEQQYDMDTVIPTYRLPKSIALKEKRQLTKNFINTSTNDAKKHAASAINDCPEKVHSTNINL